MSLYNYFPVEQRVEEPSSDSTSETGYDSESTVTDYVGGVGGGVWRPPTPPRPRQDEEEEEEEWIRPRREDWDYRYAIQEMIADMPEVFPPRAEAAAPSPPPAGPVQQLELELEGIVGRALNEIGEALRRWTGVQIDEMAAAVAAAAAAAAPPPPEAEEEEVQILGIGRPVQVEDHRLLCDCPFCPNL